MALLYEDLTAKILEACFLAHRISKKSRMASVSFHDAIVEALCFGWVDSKAMPRDDDFFATRCGPLYAAPNQTRVFPADGAVMGPFCSACSSRL